MFEFESISETKIIRKIIAYELVDENEFIFNLSLMDKDENGFVSDMIVSNNRDMEKVLATVIQTLPNFFSEFKNSKVFFSGSTPHELDFIKLLLVSIM